MPPKRKAQGSAPGQPAAQRQRAAAEEPRLPHEIMTEVVLEGLRCRPHCAFSLLCSQWQICHNDRELPLQDAILRKLRVDEYAPSEEAQALDEWPEFMEEEPVEEGGQPESIAIPYMGEVKTYWAGHSMRKVHCPLYDPDEAGAAGAPPATGAKHAYDNSECRECGCGPFRYSMFEEDVAPWDYEYPGKENPFQDDKVAPGPREIRGMGRWGGRLRKGKGYKMTQQQKRREVRGWPQEGIGRLREICPNTTGWNGYLNSLRPTERGRKFIKDVKTWRASQGDKLVRLQQRPVKWLGALGVKGLATRIISAQEGVLTWGDETLDLLPFIPRWMDRFDPNGGFRETTGRPPPSASQSAVYMAPFSGVKKHYAPEPPGQDTLPYEYKHIRHLMINAYSVFRHGAAHDVSERFGHPHPHDDGPQPFSVWAQTQSAIRTRVRMECNVPLYVDYQAMTALETLYLDLTNIVRNDFQDQALYVREVLGLAQRLEGKKLQRLVIAGLRTDFPLWPGERDLAEVQDVAPPVANPMRWAEVNWMYEFRKAVRPGGKVFLVDAHESLFGAHADPLARFVPWVSTVERRPSGFRDPQINVGNEVIWMDRYPLFMNTAIDRHRENNPPAVPEQMPDGMDEME